MMKIARKRKVKINGQDAELEVCTRGPFLTEASMYDGGRNRRLVVTLHGTDLRIRYARSKRVLCIVGYSDLVRRERAAKWKLAPGRRA